jgi:polar amino acid transport system substrate-binding protein
MTIVSIAFESWPNQLVLEKPKLTLYTEHWPPYQSIDEQGNISGLSVNKIKKTLDAVNWPYEIIVMPWARAMYQIHKVPNSLIFSIARFPERESAFNWLVKLSKVESKLVTFQNRKKIIINDLSDLKGYMTILKRGEASSTYFIENNLINEKKIIWVTSSKQALHLLSIGRGDIYPTTIDSFTAAVKDSPYTLSQFNYIYDFKKLDVDLYLASSKKNHNELLKNIIKLFEPPQNNKIN